MTSATRRAADVAEAREAALRKILDVLNRSRDDEGPVFDAVLASAADLCGAEAAGLYLVDAGGESFTLVRNLGDETEMFDQGRRFALDAPLFMAVAIRGAEVVAIDDLSETELYRSGDETLRRFVDEEGVRSRLVVPLLDRGEAVGCIALSRREVRPFAPDEIALIEAFAAQAVIAVENAQQFRELQTRLERETATGEILDVVSRSQEDAAPVFEVIAETAARLCRSDRATIWRVEDGEFVLAANTQQDDARAALLAAAPVRMGEDTVAGRVLATGRELHVPDMQADPVFSQSHLTRETGVRSFLGVPLRAPDGAVTGVILLARDDLRPFSDEHVALARTFAAQASIAVENARSFRELQARLEREAATREILEVISRSRDDEMPVFEAILEAASRLCHAPLAFLTLADEARANVLVPAYRGTTPEFGAILDDFSESIERSELAAVSPVATGEIFRLADMKDTDLYRSGELRRVQMVDVEGVRSVVAVPLLQRGLGLGALVLYRREIAPFSDDEVALLQAFAAQAVIAIENVRQFRELQARLERESATRGILDIISRSRDDESPVFEAVLSAAARLCDAPFAGLYLADRERGLARQAAAIGARSNYLDRDDAVWPLDNPASMPRCIAEGRVIHVEDLVDTDLYRDGDKERVAAVELEGMRSYLAVPLLSGGVALGAVGLYRREVRPFAADQITLVEAFAAQAVIAIENVRQFREVQERLERETATAEVLEVISRSRDDEQPVFEAILQRAARLCDAQGAGLHMIDEQASALRLMCNWGVARGIFNPGFEMPLDGPMLLPTAVRERRVASVADLRDTEAYRQGDPGRVELADEEGVRSWLIFPMVRNGEGMGALTLSRHEVKPFSDDEIALVETFAAQAVIAIENVRQFREVQERLEREAASRDVLEVISVSRDDDAPVFDVILRNAAKLCNAPVGWLVLVDDDGAHFTLTAFHGGDARSIRIGERFALETPYGISTAINEARVVTIDDLADTDLYRAGDEAYRRLVDEEGLRSRANVPLIGTSGAIGCMMLSRFEAAPFHDDEIALLRTFAAQAVIAIENVRQFREVQARLERETATREILGVISQSRDDERPVFDAILQRARRLCDAGTAGLMLGRPDDAHLTLAALNDADGPAEADDDRIARANDPPMRMDPNVHVSAQAIRSGRVVHIADLAETESYRSGDPTFRIMVDEQGQKTMLSVPIFDARGAIGAINLHRREPRPFGEDEIALVESFAAQAVIAIENVRQFKALENLNAELGERVEEQVGELERMGRLKRFLSPQVAQAITSAGDEAKLSSHRALVAVLFADIRGFTAFCETAEPEETIEVLQTYHEEMGRLLHEHGAGVDHRSGDGIMAIFNDPLPCDDPAGDAVRLAVAMRARMKELCRGWRKLGHRLGFGVGVSLGYATVGMVGSEGRYDYTASGTAVNLGARLCDRAADGEILLSPRAAIAVEDEFSTEPVGEMDFKGLREPVEVFRLAAGPDD